MTSELVNRSDLINIENEIQTSSSIADPHAFESLGIQSISFPSSNGGETVYIIEKVDDDDDDDSKLNNVPLLTPVSQTPLSRNNVSAPVLVSSMNVINDFHDSQTSLEGEVIQINVESSVDVKTTKSETESGVFQCDSCDYSSNNKHYLKQHVDLVHISGRPYKCPFCDYAGKRNHSLREHLVVHSNERPYECNHCNATFRKKGHLTNHVKLHTSPKLIKCAFCTVTETLLTDQKSYLEHMQSVHKTNKLFACDMCEFVTQTEENIRNHIAHHNSDTNIYQCGMCSFVTKDYALIEAHLESHSIQAQNTSPPVTEVTLQSLQTARPVLIKCSECGFTASETEKMKEHMIQHIAPDESSTITNIKTKKDPQSSVPPKASYKCTDCSFISGRATSFIHHMLIHKRNAKEKDQKASVKALYNIKPVSKENSCKTTNAPFYHDESTGRFICTICGYGCEYQRTIKSHIWKHCGNQDVVYPMFQNGPLSVYEDNVNITSQTESIQRIIPPKDLFVPVKKAIASVEFPGPNLKPGTTICKIKISEDKMIAYMKEELKPGDSNTTIVNTELRVLLEQSPLKAHFNQKQPLDHVLGSNLNEGSSVPLPEKKLVPITCVSENTTMERENKYIHPTSTAGQVTINQVDETSSSKPSITNELNTQAVVVEEVNALPCTQEFTGMSSLHNSPKRPLSPILVEHLQRKKSKTQKDASTQETTKTSSVTTIENMEVGMETTTKLQPSDKSSDQKPANLSVRSEMLGNGPRTRSKASSEKKKTEILLSNENEMESEEGIDKGQSGIAPSGICSSLLAVIEQLRERSKTDVDVENYSKLAAKKTTTIKRRSSRKDSSDDELPPEFADSIEKISEEGELRYRCKFCHYSNPKPLLIRIHMRLHKSKKPFECSLCDFVARSMEGLQMHMIQHCKVRTYQCKLCPSAFNYKSQLRAHMRAHTEKDTYICDFCDFVTANLTAYRQHTLVHVDNSSFACGKCQKKYSSKINLLRHVCEVNQGDSVEEEQGLSSDEETIPAIQEMKCPHCSFITIDVSEFTSHSTAHVDEDLVPVPLQCELCDFTAVSNRSLKSHMKRHINDQRYVQQPLEQYKCNLCGYVCHHLPSLKSHMWRHASDRNYSYEFTNDVINAAIDYDIRIDGRDINDPEILDRVLNSERKIVEGRLNNTEQPGGRMPVCWVTFRCCQCGFETINKPELNVHMRSHSDIIKKTLDVSQTPGKSVTDSEIESQPNSSPLAK